MLCFVSRSLDALASGGGCFCLFASCLPGRDPIRQMHQRAGNVGGAEAVFARLQRQAAHPSKFSMRPKGAACDVAMHRRMLNVYFEVSETTRRDENCVSDSAATVSGRLEGGAVSPSCSPPTKVGYCLRALRRVYMRHGLQLSRSVLFARRGCGCAPRRWCKA